MAWSYRLFLFLVTAILLVSKVESQCSTGDIRLVGGSSPNEGRVEVCVSGEWGTVCDDSWDNTDAQVVCRQLGYTPTGSSAHPFAHFGPGSGSIHMDNVRCDGSEERLYDCSHTSQHDCSHFEDASVICSARSQCVEGDVRLEGGSTPHEGRVEVCVNEDWGTVCDDSFGAVDAGVVCHQLGFSRIGVTIVGYPYSPFGLGNDDIAMDEVACTGDESRLIDCQYDSNHNCFHFEDVGIYCNPTVQCTEGAIRLVGAGDNLNSTGRVEVCLLEQWSSLCSRQWTALNSRVTCRQLGFLSQGLGTITTIPGSGPMHQGGFTCSGDENRLVECTRSTSPSSCSHSDDLTIQCSTEVLCEHGAVRLAGGSEMSGRVEVCVNEEWGTVCDDLWGNTDARVVCRQLGFSAISSTAHTIIRPGSGPIHLDDVQCTGTEDRLLSCQYRSEHNCIHFEDASVNCQPHVCENGDVRLVSSEGETGEGVTRGRVEVCWNETWGTVCDQSWTATDAAVVCRELGFSQYAGASSFSNAYFGQGSGPILLKNVGCSGSERALIDCTHDPIGELGVCSHSDDAGVSCRSLRCEDGDLRLEGGLSEYEGRLEVCNDESWGTVCDDGWVQSASQVACRQMNFNETVNVEFLRPDSFGTAPSSTSILLDEVMCTGDESVLVDCIHSPVGIHNCAHNEDVNLRCGQCSEYDVRLVDGDAENEGRVEVCVSGRWGTVCDDGWGNNDAKVICRQLGLPSAGSRAVRGGTFSPNPSLPIVMDAVTCNGEEASLGDCLYRGSEDLRSCSHDEDAGVRCPLATPDAPSDVVVVSVSTSSIQLSWSPPPSSDNPTVFSPVTAYIVSCTSPGQTTRSLRTQSDTVLSATVRRLQPFTLYECCVSANSAVGQGLENCTQEQTAQLPPSDPPQSVRGVPTSSRSISLSWQPPSTPNGAILAYYIIITELDTSISETVTTQNLEKQVTRLHPYYTYSIRVAAVTVAEGPYSSPIEIQTYQDVPSAAPSNLVSPSNTSTSITITWEPPPAHECNGIITYHKIGVRAHLSGVTTFITIPMPALSHNVVGLQPFTAYYVAVAAGTVNGTGPFTSELSVHTPQDVPSSPPLNVRHVTLDATTLRLEWSPPDPEDRNGVISYYSGMLNDTITGQSEYFETSMNQFTFPNRHPYYTYQYSIAAVTIGPGPYSSLRAVQMPQSSPSGAPQNFRARDTRRTSITLVWQPPPASQQNGIITNYTVRVTPTVESQYTVMTTELLLIVSPLLGNSPYTFAVAASTVVGIGPYSSPITASTEGPDVTSPPRDVSLSVLDFERLRVTWTPPPSSEQSGELSGYTVRVTEVETGRIFAESTAVVTLWTLTGLHPYYQYRVQVAALSEAGLGQYSDTVSARTMPDAPSGAPEITHTEATTRSVVLRWSPLPPDQQNGIITGYVINVLEDGQQSSVPVTYDVTEYTLEAAPYREYVLSVAAVNSVGQGPFSDITEIRTPEDAPTHEPRDLVGIALSSTSIQLQWESPPDEHHNGEIDTYTILCTEVNTEGTLTQHSTHTTSITIVGLHPFYTYNCNVSAVTVGPGPFSSIISITTLEDAPGAPYNLLASDIGPSHIYLSWTEPDPSQQNGIIRHYHIYVTPVNPPSSTIKHTTASSYTSHSLTALHPHVSYRITVAAVTIVPGPNSTALLERTLEAPPSASPLGVLLTPSSPHDLSVSWQAPPTNTQNGVLRYYIVKVLEVATGTVTLLNTSDNSVQYTVQTLHPYYVYDVRVAAGTIGLGPYSSANTIRMPEAAPSSAPINLQLAEKGATYALLHWSPPPDPDHNGIIRRYQINLREDRSSGTGLNLTTSGPQSSMHIDFLQPNTAYSCSVAAVTVAAGPASVRIQFTTDVDVPGTVQNLMANALSPRSMRVSWQPPMEEERNGEILDYHVNVTLVGSTGEPHTFTTPTTSIVVDSLHPHYIYLCSVTARTRAGLGPVTTILERLLPDIPSGPPVDITAVPSGPQSLYLSWSSPAAEEQNGNIVQYRITIMEAETNTTRTHHTHDSKVSYIIRDLHPYYRYSYRVTAFTSVGHGPYSIAGSIQMPPDVPSAPPLQLMVTNVFPGVVSLTWEPPASEHHNGEITGYVLTAIDIESSSLESQNKEIETTAISVTIRSLRPSWSYNFTVRAVTVVGRGPSSYPVTIVTLHGVPPAPSLGGAERISASQISVHWEPIPENNRGGPITHYTVKYYPLSPDGRVRKSIEDLFQFVDTNQTEVVIRDLNPVLGYAVSVGANTVAGIGNYSNEVTVGLSESNLFQVFVSGAIDCKQWVLYHIETKVEALGASLTSDLDGTCKCDFSAKFILFNRPQCLTSHPDWLILWGRVVGTNTANSTAILNHLQVWVEQESKVVVEGVHLTTLKYCSVFLKEGELPFCEAIFTENPSSPTTEAVISDDNSESSSPLNTYIIVAVVVVIMVMLVIVVIVCIVTVTVWKKKAHNRQLRFMPANPISTYNMSAVPNESMEAKCKFDYSDSKDIYDCADAESLYESILDPPPPPFPPNGACPPLPTGPCPPLPNEPCPPQRPAEKIDMCAPNAYHLTPQRGTMSLLSERLPSRAPANPTRHYMTPRSDACTSPPFEGRLLQSPKEYNVLQHGASPFFAADVKLSDELPTEYSTFQYDDDYEAPFSVTDGEVKENRASGEEEGEVKVKEEEMGVGREGGELEQKQEGSGYKELKHVTKTDDGEYASLMMQPRFI